MGTPLTLGSVIFDDFQAPPELALIGQQKVAVHDMIGGSRRVQALGVVWKPISFEGIFWGNKAFSTMHQLERMQAEATPQSLSYLDYAFLVVVSEVEARIKHQNRIDYKVTVEVVQETAGVSLTGTAQSLDAAINRANVAAAAQLQSIIANDSVNGPGLSTSYTTMTKAVDAAGPAASASGATATAALSAISTAVMAAQTYKLGQIANGSTYGILLASQYLKSLTVIQKNFQQGQAPQTVSVSGGSLFDIASQCYGDPSLATQIRLANNLTSNHLPSGVLQTLVLPPLLPTVTLR